MRIIIGILIACGIIFAGYQIVCRIKFDTTVSITVVKGPFKGVNFKLMDYKVSLYDINHTRKHDDTSYKHEFWDSELGKLIFNQLSSTLQTAVKTGVQYINVEFDVNYFGLLKKHYNIQNFDEILT